jgi:hypothetical protein
MTDEPKMVQLDVTCVQAGCVNQNVKIRVQTFEHAEVMCGPCSSILVDDVPEA